MKVVRIREVEKNLRALLDRLRNGASVLIVDQQGRPLARLDSVRGVAADGNDRLTRLLRHGVVRPPRGEMPTTLVATAPPRAKKNASAVRALLDDRRDGLRFWARLRS